jgi:hypothetical protein
LYKSSKETDKEVDEAVNTDNNLELGTCSQ